MKLWNSFFWKKILSTLPLGWGLCHCIWRWKKTTTMFLREAFSVFKTRYHEISISFTAFWKLKPKNILLLKNTPMDQCKCKVHENFIYKLSALKINYHDNFWEECLHVYIHMLGWWMSGMSRWKKIPFIELTIDQIITYNEWIVDGDSNQWCIVKTCTTQLLQSLVMNDMWWMTLWTWATINLFTLARFVNQVTCHLFLR